MKQSSILPRRADGWDSVIEIFPEIQPNFSDVIFSMVGSLGHYWLQRSTSLSLLINLRFIDQCYYWFHREHIATRSSGQFCSTIESSLRSLLCPIGGRFSNAVPLVARCFGFLVSNSISWGTWPFVHWFRWVRKAEPKNCLQGASQLHDSHACAYVICHPLCPLASESSCWWELLSRVALVPVF
jgi:hypothetical protein